MNLREQEYVVAIAQYGSISKAADALFISQPTLSIFLSRLEDRIGTPLFEKIGKRLIPTAAGELYVRKAKEMLVIQDQFHGELFDLISCSYGRLRLGIHSRRSSHLLPKVMVRFRREYPHVDVSVMETASHTMEQELLEGNLDLILSNRFFQTDKLQLVPIYKDKLVVALSASHPACKKAVMLPGHNRAWLDLKELKDGYFILQNPHQSTRKFADQALLYSGVTPRQVFYIENMETAAQMAAEGLGAAFNVESYARYFSYEKPVYFFEAGDPDFSVQISIAYRKEFHVPRYMESFIQLIQENFNQ